MEVSVKKKYVIDNLTREEYLLIKRLLGLQRHIFIEQLNFTTSAYKLSIKMYKEMDGIQYND